MPTFAPSSEPSTQALHALELVCQSPKFVAARDKQAWLALFAADAVVRDPISAAPHARRPGQRGTPDDPLARFWETFIAPNDIRFDVLGDVAGQTWVVRDVNIHTRLASGLELLVPAHLRYLLSTAENTLHLQSLAAHWELPSMVTQVLASGTKGLKTMASISASMLRHQGLSGALGYSTGFLSAPLAARKRRLTKLVEALAKRPREEFSRLVGRTPCTFNGSTLPAPSALLEGLESGRTSLRGSRFVQAGAWGSASLTLEGPTGPRRGLVFAEFAFASTQISSLDWYLSP